MDSLTLLFKDLPALLWLVLVALVLVGLLAALLLRELHLLKKVQVCEEASLGRDASADGRAGDGAISLPMFSPREQQLWEALGEALAVRGTEPFFQVYVQPLYRLGDGRLLGGEALIRWQHAELGPISPGEFIPVAEMTGQILQLDRLVLAEVIESLSQAPRGLLGALRLSVNASIQHFYSVSLVHYIRELCDRHGVPISCLELEVTEHASCDDLERIQASMRLVRSYGMGLALDDFGTGYTSLRFLQSLPFDRVKLDRSYVSRIDHDQQTRRLLSCLVEMAHTLEMSCVAEGIERREELEQLRRMGCDAAQGYLLGRPMPWSEFIALAERSLLINGEPLRDPLKAMAR
ncbi:EAL domain-containing protein [uncultured Halomonas sp.]|uniref:EAL domain-containing protein n=1 Tax=uncultured Halomonas sp. TaxID=173971 RepID=UPI00260CFF2B|nr:EAL domain-containing protein [uncultured Halomonas sp.]